MLDHMPLLCSAKPTHLPERVTKTCDKAFLEEYIHENLPLAAPLCTLYKRLRSFRRTEHPFLKT